MFKKVQFVKSVYNLKDLPPPDFPEIVFLGRSNVGKSSLINAFLNRKKVAKISSTPGFTKSINLFLVNSSFYLVDLPGYGFAKAPQKLIQRWPSLIEEYLTLPRNIKVLILIFDLRRIPDELDLTLIKFVNYLKKFYIVVFNKIDTLATSKIETQKNKFIETLKLPPDLPIFLTSCKTKEGIKKLRNFILSKVEKD
ncbi:MAG: ribosome biogenesis GTP-binding protein YihA/YsxC [Thermodesulfobacteriaceae bacterium]|nr:ribosome biogenesis GTP-binding protein YihA/YsxC [Thermodesulfobacteriaceae bacterium]MCX8041361.1 ribosome biogenesis GTP-binding protein YihA/YsxC [Thermodesulfobacteriaceae bacterium]MDW8135633.1 ribosome biogenesis GTP-binding protein YihA/YsxC [Thermodesulfobacterium sp.]